MSQRSPERVTLSREKLANAVGDRWSDSELSEAVELLTRADGRFPAGVRALPAELVKAVQHQRLLAAMVNAVTEIGYNTLTVQNVLTRAGISRPTFYEQFDDKEDCFLAAFDASAARMRERIDAAVADAGPSWRDRLRGGLAELLRFAAEESEEARTVIVEARASSPAGLRRRDELLDRFAACIDALVREDLDSTPSAIAAAGVVGGIESVLYARLQKDKIEELDGLLPSLMYFAVLAYAGRETAGDELDDAALA
jgi:AcrR family transcriptional regulator